MRTGRAARNRDFWTNAQDCRSIRVIKITRQPRDADIQTTTERSAKTVFISVRGKWNLTTTLSLQRKPWTDAELTLVLIRKGVAPQARDLSDRLNRQQVGGTQRIAIEVDDVGDEAIVCLTATDAERKMRLRLTEVLAPTVEERSSMLKSAKYVRVRDAALSPASKTPCR